MPLGELLQRLQLILNIDTFYKLFAALGNAFVSNHASNSIEEYFLNVISINCKVVEDTPFNKWVRTIFYLFVTFMLHLKQWILHWDKLHHYLNNICKNAVKFVTIKPELLQWCAVCFNHFTLSEENRGLFKIIY